MYHQPVMLEECLQGLNIRPEGVYADLTFGGGGHAKAILSRLTTGKLIAFDQDNDSLPQAEALKNYQQFVFIQSNFRYFYKYLNLYGYKKIDGILADLGISSHQIDDVSRGFSIRGNALLDMRMNTSQPKSAKEVLNEYDENRLTTILKTYGEVPNAYKIAQAIVRARTLTPIVQTLQLVELLKPFAPRGKENKFFAQVFQAIRIEVNEEIDALKEMLLATKEALVAGGRLVVISYHSLEDRLVKNFMRSGKFEGEPEKDFYGNLIRPFRPLPPQPMTPSENELVLNSRSRSAKLRIAEKL